MASSATSYSPTHKRARDASVRDDVKFVNDEGISSLSDDLLIRILEYLPLIKAMEVCCLSKRLSRLWASMSKLSFEYCEHPKFGEFVDSVLKRYDSGSIHKFGLSLRNSEENHSKLSNWMRFAVTRSVSEIELSWIGPPGKLELPEVLCFCSTLQKMSLRELLGFGRIEIPNGVSWTSMRCLSLHGIRLIDNDMLKAILAGCPVLEELEMMYYEGITMFDFSSLVSLKKFSTSWNGGNSDMSIHCSNLQSLVIRGSLQKKMYYLYNPSSLAELLALDNVQILAPPLLELRILVVTVKSDMRGLACMLRSSPSLEILCIEVQETVLRKDYMLEAMETYQKLVEDGHFHCLRSVTMRFDRYDCMGKGNDALWFLKFILKNALMLEELRLVPKKYTEEQPRDQKQLAKVLDAVSSFKKSSRLLKIVLC